MDMITIDRNGYDENGALWVTFEVDYFAEQTDGVCSICGADLSEGYMCMDDASQEVCMDHVNIEECYTFVNVA